MNSCASDYRLDGIYTQRQEGFYMQRVKLPAGVISADQARMVAAVSRRFGQGAIHLTSRGSMEIHWLKEHDLPLVKRDLAKVGLTSRGACGGAVRGITCGSQGAQGFPVLESLAWSLHRHFTGNPRFERLPKKFKVGIEADVTGGRHLIQDVGLVLSSDFDGSARYDIWIAGGLGREPRPGFQLARQVAEERIIPIIEAVIAVYAANVPPPKRLKFLAAEWGEEKLRQAIENEAVFKEEVPVASGLPKFLVTEPGRSQRVEMPVFAGALSADQLEKIAAAAERCAEGVLMVTANQNIALHLSPDVDAAVELQTLQQVAGLSLIGPAHVLRVCPGSHKCRMGLAPTVDIARELLAHTGVQGAKLSWAISGCLNSCTQPQLAAVGIVTSALVKGEDAERSPRFDLYRSGGTAFGTVVARSLTLQQLLAAVDEIG